MLSCTAIPSSHTKCSSVVREWDQEGNVRVQAGWNAKDNLAVAVQIRRRASTKAITDRNSAWFIAAYGPCLDPLCGQATHLYFRFSPEPVFPQRPCFCPPPVVGVLSCRSAASRSAKLCALTNSHPAARHSKCILFYRDVEHAPPPMRAWMQGKLCARLSGEAS